MSLEKITFESLSDNVLPLLDKEAFSKLECNRCGQCCTNFRPHNDRWESEHDGALGVLEAYGKYETQGWVLDVVYLNTFQTMLFYGQLEAVPEMWEGQKQHYRCGYYQEDEGGKGFCLNYQNRPYMCSDFPYDFEIWSEERQRGEESIAGTCWDKCSWNVRWLDFEVVQ